MALLIIAAPVTVHADSISQDFENVGMGDFEFFTNVNGSCGSYVPGTGAIGPCPYGGPTHRDVWVYIDFEETTIVNTVTVEWRVARYNSSSVIFNYFDDGEQSIPSGTTPQGTRKTSVFTINSALDGFSIFVSGSNVTNTDGLIYEISYTYQAETNYYKPIAAQNLSDWTPHYNLPDPLLSPNDTTMWYSAQQTATVHAAADGSILWAGDLYYAICDDYLAGGCDFWVPGSSYGGGVPLSASLGSDVLTLGGSSAVVGSVKWAILEADDGTLFHYFLGDTDFIETGQEVQAGCAMGHTAQFRNLSLTGEISIPPIVNYSYNERGAAFVAQKDSEDNLITDLDTFTLEPGSKGPCNVDIEYSQCLGDAALTSVNEWQTQGAVSFNDPGATLPSNSRIYSDYNLDSDQQPTMKVSARSFGAGGRIRLTLGTTQSEFDVGSNYQEYSIPGGEHEASASGFYLVEVANLSTATIELQYICVHFTTDSEGIPLPPEQPPTCYFENYSFNDGVTDWTVDSGVSPGISAGEIHVPSTQTFSQSVHLYPGDYTIRVRSGLRYYVSYSPDESEATDTLAFSYEYDTGPESMGSATFGELAQGLNSYTYVATFNVASETTDDFIFTPTLTTSEGSVVGAAVRDVCLFAGDDPDAPFPGYDEEDGTPEPPLFPEQCEVAPYPQGDNVGHWLAWHWHNLNQFFQCDLMILLNKMYTTMQKFFISMQYAFRWFMGLNTQGVDWLGNQFLPWLAGYLSNAGGNTIVYSSNNSDSCKWYDLLCHLSNALDIGGELMGKLFDLLTLALERVLGPIVDFFIDIASRTVDFIFDLLEALLQLAFVVLNKLLELFGLARDLFASIISAWNDATPETLPGIPDCSVGANQFVGLCLALWVMENTFFGGDVGSLIIPVFTSLMGILMVLYFIRQWKLTVNDLVGALE